VSLVDEDHDRFLAQDVLDTLELLNRGNDDFAAFPAELVGEAFLAGRLSCVRHLYVFKDA